MVITSYVDWALIEEIGDTERAERIVGGDTPFRRLFEGASVPAYRLLVVEFLSTFAYRPPMRDGVPVAAYDPDREISFRLGGVYREMTIGRFGVLTGLYYEPETVTRMFTEAIDTLPEPALREWWLTISTTPFGQDKTRASTIRDPLIRFMHYLIATSICPRTRSREWVTRQDLFFLYCLCTGTRCHLARGLAAHFASCRHMQERSKIYGGCYITSIATSLGVLTYRLHLTPIQGKAIGRPMLFPMGLVRDFGTQGGLRWIVDGALFEPPPAPFFGPHPRPEDYNEAMEEQAQGEGPSHISSRSSSRRQRTRHLSSTSSILVTFTVSLSYRHGWRSYYRVFVVRSALRVVGSTDSRIFSSGRLTWSLPGSTVYRLFSRHSDDSIHQIHHRL